MTETEEIMTAIWRDRAIDAESDLRECRLELRLAENRLESANLSIAQLSKSLEGTKVFCDDATAKAEELEKCLNWAVEALTACLKYQNVPEYIARIAHEAIEKMGAGAGP